MRKQHCLLILATVLITGIGLIQAADSGTLIIKATDKKDGSPLPGMVVEIKNSKGLSVPQPKQTDATGTANFLLPPGGGYSVHVSGAGMSPQDTEEFKIEIGKTKTVLFSMSGQRVEKVEVRAKAIDLDEGAEQSVQFTDTFVEDLPILGRTYQNVLTLAPGVNDSNGDGNPNVHGSRERDFKMTLDGVSNRDPLTGQYLSNVNTDAIEEIEVVTNGAPADYHGAVGGFGKIITKQGTNAFDGSASLYVRSSFFDGDTINSGVDAKPAVYHDVHPSLTFSGAVVKDKLFFFIAHEYLDVGVPVPLLGGGGLVIQSKGTRNLDKLTWQVSARNKFTFQLSGDPVRTGPLGVNTLTDPQSGFDVKQGGPTYQVHWDSQVSSVLGVQSLVGFQHLTTSVIPNTNGVKNECGVDLLGDQGLRHDPSGNLGGPPLDEDYCRNTSNGRRSGSYVYSHDDDRIRYTAKSDVSYFLDNFLGVSHTLKAGVEAVKNKYAQTETWRPFSIFEERGPTAVPGSQDAGGGTITRYVFTPGLPYSATSTSEGSSFGFFVEDQFRPHPNVSVRIGARVDQENLGADGYKHFDPRTEAGQFQKGYNACVGNSSDLRVQNRCARVNFKYFHVYEFFPSFASSQLGGIQNDPATNVTHREPERFRISNTNISPRLSLAWDPWGTNGKMKFFASADRLYDDTYLALVTFEQPTGGPDYFVYQYSVLNDERDVPNPNGDGTIRYIIPLVQETDAQAQVSPATIRQVDRNLKTQYADDYTIGFQREIFQETTIKVTAIKRYYRDQQQDTDVNHFARDIGSNKSGCVRLGNGALVPRDYAEGHPHPDGIFDDCGGKFSQGVEVPDKIPDLFIYNPFFNQIFRIGNFNKTDYKAYQFEVTRRLHRNWQLEASYVWSKATGNAEDFAQALGDDPTTTKQEKGFLSTDQRHVVKVNASTQLPLWNVRLGSAFTWQTGLPFSYREEHASLDQRRFFGTFGIRYPQIRTTYPTHQRNDQRNEACWKYDMSARKDFTVGKTNLQASVDAFNVLNTDCVVIDEIFNDRVRGFHRIGRQFQVGAKITF